jgi:dTDP-D-glucose 4,6-dehydratase
MEDEKGGATPCPFDDTAKVAAQLLCIDGFDRAFHVHLKMNLAVLKSSNFLRSIQPLDRPLGHDRRYAIDSSSAQRELKWKPLRSFEEGLAETIQSYKNNQSWWQPLVERTGRY